MTRTMRKLTAALTLAAALGLGAIAGQAPAPATAQGLFDPVIKVNGDVVTRYELQQRAKLLSLLGAPADPARLARDQLIEERLKMQAAQAQGVTLSDEAVQEGMERFASRGNLTAEQMIKLLENGGVSRESFREFVRSGLTWRELIQARFGPRISVSEEDLERARAAISTGAGVRVLLSEIIIPYTPQTKERVENLARRISETTSISEFSAQARRYSATATRGAGGRLPWQPITKLPPVLRPLVIGLAPGEVTEPLPIQGAVALFQMRDIEETDVPEPEYAAIEYAAYYIPGGRSESALARVARIDADTDTCDDLYGVAKDEPESMLERGSKAPAEIPDDIAIALSALDPGEVATVTRANGQTLVLLMLCGRSEVLPGAEEPAPAEDGEEAPEGAGTTASAGLTQQLSEQIGNQRLDSFAKGYLAQLRSEARIIEY
ncbi:peptidylprolyl isomerase [Roseovarius spongiae]|uniref:Parvulin-like PPIase n=1 Tax=Roseovarius spongiae TaxID=2320272 RepID=A0A3A8BBT2_9RHOB|nr:SurA N-terminal domain-containing protein [Roseovarius spongiae]RKF16932.1 peptidylprolyl isomerase [Roseovarius spongiae]